MYCLLMDLMVGSIYWMHLFNLLMHPLVETVDDLLFDPLVVDGIVSARMHLLSIEQM